MGEPIERALVARGRRVRVYTPYGAMLPGMAYLVRRLLENTSNESFLKASFAGGTETEDLLRDPEELGAMLFAKRRTVAPPAPLPRFQNEPLTDFTRPRSTVEDAGRAGRGDRRPEGRALSTLARDRRPGVSRDRNPWKSGRPVILRSDSARRRERELTTRTARLLPLGGRSIAGRISHPGRGPEVLLKAASILKRDRFKLSALEVYECGKPWREADGDIAEAIDFCEFYAREMIRIGCPQQRDVPGETNAIERISRGVIVVIPPWNFPLAIPMGMTAAALVAGNTVIFKPAEQSPVMGWQLYRVLTEAGLPPGVLQYLPGRGEVRRPGPCRRSSGRPHLLHGFEGRRPGDQPASERTPGRVKTMSSGSSRKWAGRTP